MKKFILNYVLLPLLLFAIFNALVIAIAMTGPSERNRIIKNIEIAEAKYGGKAEEALIAYLLDTTNTPDRRSHVAIWTLGHIKSQKALPFLKEYYHNDPMGYTCFKKHDSVLCQCCIFKAITAIESKSKLYQEFKY